jgi:DNA polymerase (family 10)
MKNFEVARQFELMADILELKGENAFRIRAYRRAAQNLESLSEDIETVAREDRLEDIPGSGPTSRARSRSTSGPGRSRRSRPRAKGSPGGWSS